MSRLAALGRARWLPLALFAAIGFACLGAGLTWSAQAGPSPHGMAIDFTPHGSQPGLDTSLEPPLNCMSCHRDDSPNSAPGFMPHNTWAGSMMAHATRDPLFWAALDVANADVPGVGDYCLRCHTPKAWLAGRVRKTPGGSLVNGENGCLLTGDHDNLDTKSNDYSGLTCHFCHRMTQTGPSGEIAPTENGNFWIDDSKTCETETGTYGEPCRYGPYRYSASDPLTPPHAWRYSRFHESSQMCGVCHDVSTPTTSEGPLKTLILPDGQDSGIPMPVERTYAEWQQSEFADVVFRNRFGDDLAGTPALARGATCQDCHMASSDDPIARACTFTAPGARTGNLPVHEFVGANTWVPAIIRDEYADGIGGGGIEDRPGDIDRTILRARHMLTERSATIETVVVPSGTDQLNASVKVTNLAGHKLPTGYAEGRRMWLHVVARDEASNVLWENGAWNPVTGALSEDAQTRVYETLQGIWNGVTQTCEVEDTQGRKMFHFVLNNCIAKDNRIPPLGFAGGTNLETRPVGHVYPPVAPGAVALVNFDVAEYVIPLPSGFTGQVTVTATLKFQIASDDYVQFLNNQAAERGFPAENVMCSTGPGRPFDVGPQGVSRGAFIYQLWNDPEYGRSPPEDMVSATDAVTL